MNEANHHKEKTADIVFVYDFDAMYYHHGCNTILYAEL